MTIQCLMSPDAIAAELGPTIELRAHCEDGGG
jgi:hypothetical protein